MDGRNRYTRAQQTFYRNYLNSPEWKKKRAARLKLAGYRCEFVTATNDKAGEHKVRCPRTRYLCVHHNTYERLGNERDADLDVYCWFHHMIEHLLWKTCHLCGQPCLGHDALAELWLAATLAQMQINLDVGSVDWRGLPTKEQLAMQINIKCMRCRGISLGKDDP